MIVRMSHRQLERVRRVVDEVMPGRWREPTMEWLDRDVASGGKHRVDIAMPAIAWWRVRDVMFDHCYDARGFRSRTVKVSDMNALKAIQRASNVRSVHPALSRTSAIGMIGELVPAWRLFVPIETRLYSAVPAEGVFAILAPETSRRGGETITTWVEAIRPPERPLLDEREHLRFV